MNRSWAWEWRNRSQASRILVGGAILVVLGGCGVASSEGGGGSGGNELRSEVSSNDESTPEESTIVDDVLLDRGRGEGGEEGKETSVIAAPSTATACTANNQCPAGSCVDGFCCDTKCDNKCMACSAAKKGSGVDGICGSIKYDTDPDNDCPFGACDGKNQCKNYNGFSCTAAPQCLSNYCVDGVCCGNICMGACAACTAAKKGSGIDGVCGSIAVNTDPDNECTGSACNGSGACQTAQTTSANGTACTSAAQCASGFCADGVCCDSWCLGTCQACTTAKKNQGVNGVCGPIANDKDPDDDCWGGACNGAGVCKQYNGVPCSDKSQCLSNYCVDGTCCGNICTGLCYACSESKKGQGFDGVCGPIASGRDVENECNPGECNGAGTCNQPQTPQANGTTCVSGGQCASSNCVDGYCCDTACNGACLACSNAKKGSGPNGTCGNVAAETDPDSDCGVGGKCGNGICRYYNGAPCSASAQCFSNYCVDAVCCGNICTSTCYACSAVKKGQGTDGTCGPIANTKDPDNDCNPGECNGSGACNQSQAPQADGATCALATQCVSGFCVDGVCCNAACTETCNACSAAKKGSGVNGTCGPIKYDTDPDNECYGGSCSGNGTCEQFNGLSCTATTDCLSHYCVDGFCCNNFCGGTCLACSAAKKGSGNDGQCGTIGSNTDPDNECPLGACNGAGTCTVLGAADGTVCMAGSECASGQCVDGVCCNTACTGTCVACDLPGKVGTCSNIDAGQSDPNGTPPCNDVCNGAGQCVVGGGAACMSGSECASLICRDQVCESPKPANGPLQWMTIPTWDAFTIEQIAAFNDGQGVAVLGDHGYSKLRGSFNAAGFPNLGYWGIGANTFTAYQFVARGGVIAAYETTDYYCIEPDLCSYTCYFSVPAGISGPAVYIIGKNDAGQVAAIVSSPPANCEPAPGYGIVSPTDKLMRASAAGATQLNITVPAGLQLPVVLGPPGDFHWGSGTTITKANVNGSPLWTKSATGSITSSRWDVDAGGNILIAVSFSGSINYGAGPMTATGPRDLGLIKLDPAGNVVWQKHFGASGFTMGNIDTLSRTGTSDMAVLGDHSGPINLGTGTLSGVRFIVKFNASGDPLWHIDVLTGTVLRIAGDLSGAVYVSAPAWLPGSMLNNVNLGWGAIDRIFMAKYQ